MIEDEYLRKIGEFFQKKQFEKAKKTTLDMVKLFPNSAEAYYNLGLILETQKEFTKAISAFKKSVKLKPTLELANLNLGVTYIKNKQTDAGINIFKKYLKINPQSHSAYFNMGLALMEKSKYIEALNMFRRSALLNPKHANSFFQIGSIFVYTGKMKSAVESFGEALKLNPNSPLFLGGLGATFTKMGRLEEAKKTFDKALKMGIDPDTIMEFLYSLAIKSCDWKNAEVYSKRLNELTFKGLGDGKTNIESPFTNIERAEDLDLNYKVAKYWSSQIEALVSASHKQFRHFKPKSLNKRVKIGYLSPDFREHPVSQQIVDIFKYHDRNRFEIYTYSYGESDRGPLRLKIEKYSEHFKDFTNKDHAEIAKIIHEDKIDILIDLVGFTGFQTPDIPAYKPAPVQISYLGYPGTTGANYIDYTIADKIVVPKPDRKFFSEKIIYMPDCFQICSQPPVKKIIFKRKDFGLPEKSIVFCSFNRPEKIERKVFDVWINILKNVPDSVLWLSRHHPNTMKNIANYFNQSGLDIKRLIFARRMPSINEHLNRIRLADIALDTLTYNGGATSTNALWVGVPVITLYGDNFASRVTSSFLKNIGVPELITKNIKDYEDLAIELALNPKRLEAIRKSLILNRNSSPLFNTKLFVKNIEKAYMAVWKKYLQDKKTDIII